MAKITTNKQGLVSLGFLSNVYTFVHDTLADCHHFDNQLPIDIIYEQDDRLKFTKKYTYNKFSSTLCHDVRTTSEGFVWEITRNVLSNELYHYRFGITIPFGKFYVEDKNGLIPTPLINYQQQWEQKYLDQTNIDLPILRIKRSHLHSVIVCTPLTNEVQFFKFKENDIEYLKVSTKIGTELNLTIHLMVDVERQSLEQTYCNIFPDNKDYVYQSELLKRKILTKHHVRVLSHEIFHRKGYTIFPPNREELESYMKLLEENLSFYPAEVFKKVGLKTISICGYIMNDSERINGYSKLGSMLLNASEKLGCNSKCRTIHHEMYHMIEWMLPIEKQKNLKFTWESLPKDDSFTEHFKHIEVGWHVRVITHPVEYRCELFATFVLDPRFIEQLATNDAIVRRKLDIVKSIFGRIGDRCNQIARNHDQKKENILVHIFEPENRESPVKISKKTLIGVKHSCLPELIGNNALIINDVSQIPNEVEIAYVTINPLDYCAIEYIEQHSPVEDSFAEWMDIHAALENRGSILRLKSEDALTFNTYAVKNFFEGAGASFEVCHLWDITKEIRPYHLDSIPFLKQVWSTFRNTPIIIRVGYSDISYEE